MRAWKVAAISAAAVLLATIAAIAFSGSGPQPHPNLAHLFVKDAVAAPSCSCSRQTNGCDWCTCVDDNGRQYCEECCSGSCNRVSCS